MHYTVINGNEELDFHVESDEDGTFRFRRGGETTDSCVDVRFLPGGRVHILRDGSSFDVTVAVDGPNVRCAVRGQIVEFEVYNDRDLHMMRLEGAGAEASDPEIESPMAGRVVAVRVETGQEVEEGAPLVVIEAMKMENLITAPHAGRVDAVDVSAGDTVEKGARLLVLTPFEDSEQG